MVMLFRSVIVHFAGCPPGEDLNIQSANALIASDQGRKVSFPKPERLEHAANCTGM
jgi:hypothetical protein